MQFSKPPLILVVGPTAVGKTEIAIMLAEALGGEIVSADSRLFYRGMDIGTAKPSPLDRSRVPHHLIDIADPSEILSLASFQQKARAAIAEIHARGKLPFLVGGTGQYIRAVVQGWSPPEVPPNPNLRATLERLHSSHPSKWLHERLNAIDPEAANRIEVGNLRRTIRALEVILTTGRRFSAQRARTDSPYSVLTIGLNRPRPELYARIDARIESMFQAGFVDEVKSLMARGYSDELPTMSAIGYREVIRVLRGQIDAEEARLEMRRATRVFVRRQANWFKESDPSIDWFRAGEAEVRGPIAAKIRSWLDFPLN
jgi:tRNA dimethylallyltransferase